MTHATRAPQPTRRSSDSNRQDVGRLLRPAALTAGLLLTAWAAFRFAAPRLLARAFRVPHVPSGPTPADIGLEAEDVTIPGQHAKRLRGWFIPAAASGPQPAALVIHGWTGSASLMLPVVPPLLAAGLHVLVLDTRRHGRSDDFTSMPDFAADAESALAWLRADPRIDPGGVVLVGHSVGAGACLMVATADSRPLLSSLSARPSPSSRTPMSTEGRAPRAGPPAPAAARLLRDRPPLPSGAGHRPG